jgi:hypothetical protein
VECGKSIVGAEKMNKKRFILAHQEARRNCAQFAMTGPDGWQAVFQPPTRTLDQNALMWPLLTALSKQIVWHGAKLSADDWKDMLTASLRKQRAAPGIDGGFVVFGERTRVYSKAKFSEMIELILAFGAQHGVEFNHE